MSESTHLTTALSSTLLTGASTSSPNATMDATATSSEPPPAREGAVSPTATKASSAVLPAVGDVPATGYLPEAEASWQIRAVLALLFAFLITLLGALCYALFSFLTAPPEPTVHATSMTDEQTTRTDESTTEDAFPTLMPPNSRATDDGVDHRGRVYNSDVYNGADNAASGSTTTYPQATDNAATTTHPVSNNDTSNYNIPSACAHTADSSSIPPGTAIRPMGETPLFCTFGAHKQNYDQVDTSSCDYAFIPFYVHGGDTFVDDSSRLTRRNRTAALADVNSATGQSTLEEYWTLKNVFHYGVFDIGVQQHEVNDRDKILKEAFDLLKAIRTEQEKLKAANPRQKKPARGFVVAGFYLWQATKTPVLRSFANSMSSFHPDAVVIVTHLTVDEHQANLECLITGGAPYQITSKNPNLYGMVEIMREMSAQPWTINVTLLISVSLCTRVYMPATTLMPDKALDVKCVDHLRRPNTTAAFCNDPMSLYANAKVIKPGHYTGISISPATPQLYCMIRQQFTTMPVGLALFDVECEDWERKCSGTSTPIAGKDRFNDIVNYFKRLIRLDPASLPCKPTP
ncbi:hypothetical protein MTO96_005925 [Rhipicephalus appendiculatus]